MSLDMLLGIEHKLERKYRGFLTSLNKAKTITLRDLLTDKNSLCKINAGWLNHERFLQNIKNMAAFFDRIPLIGDVNGYENLPLIFLQSTTKEEDVVEYNERRMKYPLFKKLSQGILPQAYYLHVNTTFFPKLKGTWNSRKREVWPLMAFTSAGQISRDINGEIWRNKPVIMGFRVPDYSELLGIGNDTATDYFSRMLIHDLGHWFLPSISGEREALHNVTMIYAMGADHQNTRHDSWERLVHAEATDPFFMFDAEKYVGKFYPQNNVQKLVLKQFKKWYSSQKKSLWKIGSEMSLPEIKNNATELIESMVDTGFSYYRDQPKQIF